MRAGKRVIVATTAAQRRDLARVLAEADRAARSPTGTPSVVRRPRITSSSTPARPSGSGGTAAAARTGRPATRCRSAAATSTWSSTRRRRTARALDDLLRHELTHASSMPGSGYDPATWWLVEGVAEHAATGGVPTSQYDGLDDVRRFVRDADWNGSAGQLARGARRGRLAGRRPLRRRLPRRPAPGRPVRRAGRARRSSRRWSTTAGRRGTPPARSFGQSWDDAQRECVAVVRGRPFREPFGRNAVPDAVVPRNGCTMAGVRRRPPRAARSALVALVTLARPRAATRSHAVALARRRPRRPSPRSSTPRPGDRPGRRHPQRAGRRHPRRRCRSSRATRSRKGQVLAVIDSPAAAAAAAPTPRRRSTRPAGRRRRRRRRRPVRRAGAHRRGRRATRSTPPARPPSKIADPGCASALLAQVDAAESSTRRPPARPRGAVSAVQRGVAGARLRRSARWPRPSGSRPSRRTTWRSPPSTR